MATADLKLTFGAMYIGCVISVSFSGIAALQAYIYFRQYRNRDSHRTKTLVLSAWALDMVHTVFICSGIWHYLVLNWGNLAELDHLTWTVGMSIAITGIITIIVHMFFAERVWRLSKNNIWITGLIVILACVRLGSALTTTAQMLRLKHFSLFISEFRWLFTFGLALSALIDVIITGALCYYLRTSRTGYSSIDDIIHRIILYTINNGLFTCLASLIDMICAASMPHNFLFLSLHFIIAKCYVNSLLSTLNSRDALRDREESSFPMGVHVAVEAGTKSQPRILFRRQQGVWHGQDVNENKRGSREHAQRVSPPTYDDMKVCVEVERTIHADGEIEADLGFDSALRDDKVAKDDNSDIDNYSDSLALTDMDRVSVTKNSDLPEGYL